MRLDNLKGKPDVLKVEESYVEIEGGLGYYQDGIMFGPDKNPMASTTVCFNRPDGVTLLIGDKAYGANGRYLGQIDTHNGNALIVLTPEEKAKKADEDAAAAKVAADLAAKAAADAKAQLGELAPKARAKKKAPAPVVEENSDILE